VSPTEPEQQSDQQLIEAANAGDASAFETLYARYRDWVVNLAFRFTADRELALDVLQETFLYLAKTFPRFTLTCQLRSFLYPAVKNLSLNARRTAARYEAGDELFKSLEAPDAKNSSNENLAAALRALPEAQREVLVLRFIEGLALQEIAEALDVPLGTVKSRIHHALAALRENPRIRELLS